MQKTDTYPWTKAEAEIIKAAYANDAGRLALDLIAERLGNLHGSSFDPDPLRMAWYEGRRFVAREIKAAIINPVEKLVNDDDSGSRSARPLSATERAARAAVEPGAGRRRRPGP